MSTHTIDAPFAVGYALCFTLMGALAVQAYVYFTRFADDRRAIKALVIVIVLLETLITGGVFVSFVTSTWQFSTLLLVTSAAGLVTTLTHGFYCWRISTLRKSHLIPLLIMMFSLIQLASIIYFSFYNVLLPRASPDTIPIDVFLGSFTHPYLLVVWLGSNVLCDSMITIYMVLSLRPSNLHFTSNKSTLVKLTRLTIETGLITSVAALLELILGIVFQGTYIHFAVFFAISKLYANSLLATLNYRLVLRSRSNPNMSVIVWDDKTSYEPTRHPGSQPSRDIQIVAQVETDVDVVVDLNESISSSVQTHESQELLDKSTRV